MKTNNNFYVWLNLKTTGPNPERDEILEYQLVVTYQDSDLTIVRPNCDLHPRALKNEINNRPEEFVYNQKEEYYTLNIKINHHEKVLKLLGYNEKYENSGVSYETAQTYINEFLKLHGIFDTCHPVVLACRKTIMTNAFLKAKNPLVYKVFNERVFDVDTIEQLYKMQLKIKQEIKTDESMDDIQLVKQTVMWT